MQKKKADTENGCNDLATCLVLVGLLIFAVSFFREVDPAAPVIQRLTGTRPIARTTQPLYSRFAVTPISPEIKRQTRVTVNLRAGPDITYERVGSVPGGTVLTVVGKSGDWHLIRRNGRLVFIAAWLTYKVAHTESTASARSRAAPTQVPLRRFTVPQIRYTHGAVNLRSGHGTKYAKVGLAAAGTRLEIVGKRGDWYLVKHGGREVYIAGWLAHENPPQQQRANAPRPGYTCNCGRTCPQMRSCAEAYFQLYDCGCGRRDGDNDGVPCENICD